METPHPPGEIPISVERVTTFLEPPREKRVRSLVARGCVASGEQQPCGRSSNESDDGNLADVELPNAPANVQELVLTLEERLRKPSAVSGIGR